MDVKEAVDKAFNLKQSGLVKEAFDAYRSALVHAPDSYPILMGAGRTASNMGSTETGIEYFRRASEVYTNRPEPLLNIGMQQSKTSLEDAATTIENAIKKFPDNNHLKSQAKTVQIRLNGPEFSDDFDFAAELEAKKYKEGVFAAVLHKRQGILSDNEVITYNARIAETFNSISSKLRYASSLIECKQYENALTVYDDLSEDFRPDVIMGRAICTSGLGQVDASKLYLESYMDGDVSAHSALTTCAKFLDRSPDLVKATDIVSDLNKKHSDTGLENLVAFTRAILPPQRKLLSGNIKESEFRMSEPGKSQAAILAFAGHVLKIGALPISLLDRFFAGHDVAVGSLVDRRGYFLARRRRSGRHF